MRRSECVPNSLGSRSRSAVPCSLSHKPILASMKLILRLISCRNYLLPWEVAEGPPLFEASRDVNSRATHKRALRHRMGAQPVFPPDRRRAGRCDRRFRLSSGQRPDAFLSHSHVIRSAAFVRHISSIDLDQTRSSARPPLYRMRLNALVSGPE